MSLCIFGGTFNPVHLAHVKVAEAAFEQLPLDRLLLIPSFIPPHKQADRLISAEHRLRMVELAIAGREGWAVSEIEIERGGRSYSIDTARTLIAEYDLQDRPYFLIGADMLQELATWKDVAQLVTLCRFVVVARPGLSLDPTPALQAAIGREEAEAVCQRKVDVPPTDVSSTDIRRRVAGSHPFEHLVPPAVADYIKQKRLYT